MTVGLEHQLSRVAVLSVILSLLPACGTSISSTSTPTAGPKVVVTSSVLCDLTQQIAAETIALTCLLKPGVDPHTYEPTPVDRKAIEDADLILMNGYDLVPRLEKLVKATSTDTETVAVAEVAVPEPLLGEGHDHSEAIDHTEEHHDQGEHSKAESHSDELDAAEEHAHHSEDIAAQEPDSHIWHSAEHGSQMIDVIQESLAKLVPEESDRYATKAQTLQGELTQLHIWIQAQIQTIPAEQRKLVTTHDALGYYADAYGIELEGALQGMSTEAQPSAARIKDLVENIKASGVPVIFAEQGKGNNSTLLAAVAKDAGVNLATKAIYADGLGDSSSDGQTYQSMLIANTKALVQGLGGTYVAFKPQ